jgi:molybdopterin molybdotransferase
LNEKKINKIFTSLMTGKSISDMSHEINDQFLIGLPGNPQSAVIGLLSLVAPFIAGSYGQILPTLESRTFNADLKGPAREVRLVLCSEADGVVTPLEHLDSSMLRGFVDAHGYAVLPAGGAVTGQILPWLNLP